MIKPEAARLATRMLGEQWHGQDMVELAEAVLVLHMDNAALESSAHRSRCDLLDEQTRSDALRAALKEAIEMADAMVTQGVSMNESAARLGLHIGGMADEVAAANAAWVTIRGLIAGWRKLAEAAP